jgi:hypothetical protein
MSARTHHLQVAPTTTIGRWSVGLAGGFVVLNALWSVLPGAGRLAVGCGIAAGVAALAALIGRGERGLVVWAAIVPLLAVVGFVLAELLVGLR